MAQLFFVRRTKDNPQRYGELHFTKDMFFSLRAGRLYLQYCDWEFPASFRVWKAHFIQKSEAKWKKKKNTIHSSISWNDYITWQLWDIEKNSVEVAVIALIKEALQVISSLLTPQLQLLLSVHLLLCYQMTSTFESQISKLPDQGHLNLATAEEKQLF